MMTHVHHFNSRCPFQWPDTEWAGGKWKRGVHLGFIKIPREKPRSYFFVAERQRTEWCRIIRSALWTLNASVQHRGKRHYYSRKHFVRMLQWESLVVRTVLLIAICMENLTVPLQKILLNMKMFRNCDFITPKRTLFKSLLKHCVISLICLHVDSNNSASLKCSCYQIVELYIFFVLWRLSFFNTRQLSFFYTTIRH